MPYRKAYIPTQERKVRVCSGERGRKSGCRQIGYVAFLIFALDSFKNILEKVIYVMDDLKKDYFKGYVSHLSDISLVDRISFLTFLLNLEEVVEESSVDFFSDLLGIFQDEMFLRYSKMVNDLLQSGEVSFDLSLPIPYKGCD